MSSFKERPIVLERQRFHRLNQPHNRLRLHRLALGLVAALPPLFLAKALGVLCVYASLLIATGLIEHAPLLEAKRLNGLALGWVCRNLPSGAVVYRPFRLPSRTRFLRRAIRRPFGAGCGGAPPESPG